MLARHENFNFLQVPTEVTLQPQSTDLKLQFRNVELLRLPALSGCHFVAVEEGWVHLLVVCNLTQPDTTQRTTRFLSGAVFL